MVIKYSYGYLVFCIEIAMDSLEKAAIIEEQTKLYEEKSPGGESSKS